MVMVSMADGAMVASLCVFGDQVLDKASLFPKIGFSPGVLVQLWILKGARSIMESSQR